MTAGCTAHWCCGEHRRLTARRGQCPGGDGLPVLELTCSPCGSVGLLHNQKTFILGLISSRCCRCPQLLRTKTNEVSSLLRTQAQLGYHSSRPGYIWTEMCVLSPTLVCFLVTGVGSKLEVTGPILKYKYVLPRGPDLTAPGHNRTDLRPIRATKHATQAKLRGKCQLTTVGAEERCET